MRSGHRQRDRRALRVRCERAVEIGAARDERVEHRIQERQRRIRRRCRTARRACVDRRVERLIDAERVAEAEELRREIVVVVRPHRRRVAEKAQRRAVEEVRADGLVLQRRSARGRT